MALRRFDVGQHDDARAAEQFSSLLVGDVFIENLEFVWVHHQAPVPLKVFARARNHDFRLRDLWT